MVVGLWGSSFKNAFHTLSYRFAAVILVILYSRGKGKELKDAEQGCIADTLTVFRSCKHKNTYKRRRMSLLGVRNLVFFVEVRSFGVTPAIYGVIFNEIIMHQIVTFRLLDILLGEDMGSWDAENAGLSLFL